ncbi:hypothetical protein GALMADRAFT_146498 [Galerina marginata CBS 339.88]|uniref:MYND-type domain-containing protein n=1 Tax=Galerina marginata (strain CBS 339.88) TaxID=685588 RepID=A0A067SE35_GALM3|nr:hypothetical protein GALMADRAFT_146498 [Galerina marginata CBS 339.88]
MAPKKIQKSRPDKHKDRTGWNASWEKELKIRYDAMELFTADQSNIVNHNTQKTSTSKPRPGLQEERVTHEMCKLQGDLVRLALERMNSDNFEQRWKESTQERREDFVLEGLYKACCVPEMERQRGWCPEMTVWNLAGNGGQSYIDLLMKFVPNNMGVKITEPTLISHPGLDAYYKKAEGATPPEIQKYRAYFIILTLWYILLAFYGENEEWTAYKPLRESNSESRVATVEILGDNWERKLRSIKRELKDDHIKFGAVTICWTCGKDASKLGPGQQLKVCARCKPIGRTIFYCSSECQKHDWKHGNPRPHKNICGRPESEIPDEVKAPSNENNKRIPLPVPGFKRSPALLHQISLQMKAEPPVDYFLVNPPPLADVGISLPPTFELGQTVKQMFLRKRDRAFKNGDHRAARFMYQFLKKYVEKAPKWTKLSIHYPVLSRLKTQFEKEYEGLDLDSDDIDPDDPTEDELGMAAEQMWAMSTLAQKGRKP